MLYTMSSASLIILNPNSDCTITQNTLDTVYNIALWLNLSWKYTGQPAVTREELRS